MTLAAAAGGCGDKPTPLPPAVPFRDAIPEVRLGLTVLQLEAARPDVALWTDGSHRESLREVTIRYYFTPRAEGEAPPAWARLRAVESRDWIGDTLVLRSAWTEAVGAIRRRVGFDPRCLRLGGGPGVIERAEFGGTVVISVSAEVWHEPDGRSYGAYLVTRVGEGSLEYLDEAGLASLAVDCGALESTLPR